MSSFDERGKGFEKKFVHDEELQFKISARKNKYLGEWASKILGYKDEKEKEKTLRQVEADLGGFDVEQEWVEEIERDNYFEVDTTLGRAPSMPAQTMTHRLLGSRSRGNALIIRCKPATPTS